MWAEDLLDQEGILGGLGMTVRLGDFVLPVCLQQGSRTAQRRKAYTSRTYTQGRFTKHAPPAGFAAQHQRVACMCAVLFNRCKSECPAMV